MAPKTQKNQSVYGEAPKETPIASHTLAIVADNEPGVLSKILGLVASRGYNIESLTAAEIDHARHLSRITLVCSGTAMVIEQIKNQLDRIVPVRQVADLTAEGPHVARELALVKVAGTGDKRLEALRIGDAFRARVIDSTLESFVFEITGSVDKVNAFINLMMPLGLIDVSRTGVAAIARGEHAIGDFD
jgi:acetolactate synthase-1/3 small subunit